jgi:hypothetical protein
MFAVLVATVPLVWVLRILGNLPEPIVMSHRRWPWWANSLLIGAVSGGVVIFIRVAYYGGSRSILNLAFQFVIVSMVYVFGLVLLVRQFSGLYPEYFVTAGRTGLSPRKALYSKVVDVQRRGEAGGEIHLRIKMESGERLHLHIPTHQLPTLREAIEKYKPRL